MQLTFTRSDFIESRKVGRGLLGTTPVRCGTVLAEANNTHRQKKSSSLPTEGPRNNVCQAGIIYSSADEQPLAKPATCEATYSSYCMQ